MQSANSRSESQPSSCRVWRDRPDQIVASWFGIPSVMAAWLGLGLALLTPPHGFQGVELCWFHSTTGLPCLGCGLTRSLSCGIRGMMSESWNYHPLGLPILALFLVLTTQSLLPKRVRLGLHNFVRVRPTFFRLLYIIFVAAFVAYGGTRILLQISARLSDPF